MVAAKTEEKGESYVQRIPAYITRRQDEPEIQHVQQRPADVGQADTAETFLYKIKVRCIAGILQLAEKAVTGNEKKRRHTVT